MPHYKVTLNQGRSDTVVVEATSVTDVKTFFETVSTAVITIIKKIVFSKELLIGSVATTYIPNNQDKYLNVMVKNEKGFTSTLNLAFPMKNLEEKKIIATIKKNLLINGSKIEEIINILKSK